MKRNQTLLYRALLVALLLPSVACTREFLYEGEEDNGLKPTSTLTQNQDDKAIAERVRAYITKLQFDLARQEMQLMQDNQLREELTTLIASSERFADQYLIYVLDDLGNKTYVYGEERIEQYVKQGYLNTVLESESLAFVPNNRNIDDEDERSYKAIPIPARTVAIFNLDAFPNIKDLLVNGANIEYLDLSPLKQLEKLTIKEGLPNLIVDASHNEALTTLKIRKCTNSTLKLASKVRPSIDIKNSYFKTLEAMNVSQAVSLRLDGVRLQDTELLKKDNPYLKTLAFSLGGDAERAVDGEVYQPIRIDKDLVSKINGRVPSLEELSFSISESADYLRSNFSELSLAKLRKLEIKLADDKDFPINSVYRETEQITFAHCPALEELSLSVLFLGKLDLSALTSSANPKLKEVSFKGNAQSIVLPAVTHNIDVEAAVITTKSITVPSSAKGKIGLTLYDFLASRSYNMVDIATLSLDHQSLRQNLRYLRGYVYNAPPSAFYPLASDLSLTFLNPILDFSGNQWRGFKGKVWFTVSGSKRNIDYIDFGHLTIDNFDYNVITVNPGCVVKNLPNGIIIKYKTLDELDD